MAYDTRDGGAGATPPFYSGSSLNPAPSNPRCDPVTVAPGAPPTPQPVAQVPPGPRINTDMFPASIPPGGGPNRGLKPLT
jgi:hypothetical protein